MIHPLTPVSALNTHILQEAHLNQVEEGQGIYNQKVMTGTSLMVQWLRSCLATQGTLVQSLVGELRSHMLQGN